MKTLIALIEVKSVTLAGGEVWQQAEGHVKGVKILGFGLNVEDAISYAFLDYKLKTKNKKNDTISHRTKRILPRNIPSRS